MEHLKQELQNHEKWDRKEHMILANSIEKIMVILEGDGTDFNKGIQGMMNQLNVNLSSLTADTKALKDNFLMGDGFVRITIKIIAIIGGLLTASYALYKMFSGK